MTNENIAVNIYRVSEKRNEGMASIIGGSKKYEEYELANITI